MPATALVQPAPRVSRTGNRLLKPAGGPPALTKRHIVMIEFMAHGLPCAFPRHPEIEPHKPLGVNEAADCAGVRRKAARDLLHWPIFIERYQAELRAIRTGEHARSIRKVIDIRDDPGAGKAADRKVQMTAALAILGEAGNGGTNVTVNNAIGVQVTPGIVVDLREDDEIEATAEGQPA